MGGPSRSGGPGIGPGFGPDRTKLLREISPGRSFHRDPPSHTWSADSLPSRAPPSGDQPPITRSPALPREPYRLPTQRRSRKRPQSEQDTIAAAPGCPGAHAGGGSATRDTDGPLAVCLTEPQMSATNLHSSVRGTGRPCRRSRPRSFRTRREGPGPPRPENSIDLSVSSAQHPAPHGERSRRLSRASSMAWPRAAPPRRWALERLPPPNDVITHRSSPGVCAGFASRPFALVLLALGRRPCRPVGPRPAPRASSWRSPSNVGVGGGAQTRLRARKASDLADPGRRRVEFGRPRRDPPP